MPADVHQAVSAVACTLPAQSRAVHEAIQDCRMHKLDAQCCLQCQGKHVRDSISDYSPCIIFLYRLSALLACAQQQHSHFMH